MFEIKKHKIISPGIHAITSGFKVLFNDGDNDTIYIGKNKFDNFILGVIMGESDDEEDEIEFVRYMHVLLTPRDYMSFFSGRITLLELLRLSDFFFIIDKNPSGEEISSDIVTLEDLPAEYWPRANSYCPDFAIQASNLYCVSLHGGLANDHLSLPEEMSLINSKISNFISKTLGSLTPVGVIGRVYSQAPLAGSFKLNYRIELQDSNRLSLFYTDEKNIYNYVQNLLRYIIIDLPKEATGLLSPTSSDTSPALERLSGDLEKMYIEAGAPIKGNLQTNVKNNIKRSISESVEQLSGIESVMSFDDLRISNITDNQFEQPLGELKTDYYDSVHDKLISEHDLKSTLIEQDLKPRLYNILVINFSIDTGTGRAIFNIDGIDNQAIKIRINVAGRTSYENTPFTESLHKKKVISVEGIATRHNGIVKTISFQLDAKALVVE
jgi:hypothetical protein